MNQAEGRKKKKTGCKWNNSWAWGGVVTEKRMTGDTYPMCDCDYVGPKTSWCGARSEFNNTYWASTLYQALF